MTFHPDALDLAQLKRLAKAMSRGSKEILPQAPLPLSKSQELLARTLGYDSWHAATKGRQALSAPQSPPEVPPAPGSASAMETPYQGLGQMKVYERILMGVFIAAAEEDKYKVVSTLSALSKAAASDSPGLWLPFAGSMSSYSPEVQEGLRLSLSYPSHALTVAEKPTTVGHMLARGLVLARSFQPIPFIYFLFIKAHDANLWTFFQSCSRSSAFVDPFKSASVRLQLFEDLLISLRSSVSLIEGFDRLIQGYRKHGWEDRASALDAVWRPGLEASRRPSEFLARQLVVYDPRAALRFELLLDVSESNLNQALMQVISDTQAEGHREDRARLLSGQRGMPNSTSSPSGSDSPSIPLSGE